MAASTARGERVSKSNGVRQDGRRHHGDKLRLVGYTRVSTDDQAANGVSLDARAERIAAHAVAHDCELVQVECDEGVSGKKRPRDRQGLRQALTLIDEGGADGLVF